MVNLKVSIIVPVFNMELCLRRTLDSIIKQTYKNIEIIVVNDGSTDNSRCILEEYRLIDERFILIHQENKGIGSAYDSAFKVMNGDYVFFVDGDDWIEIGAIEKVINLAIEHDADLVSFGVKGHTIDGKEIEMEAFKTINGVRTSTESILETYFTELHHPTLVRLYKSHVFNNVKLLEQNVGIDELLTPQLLIKCKTAVFITEKIYNIWLTQNSVSRALYSTKKINETLKVYDFLCQHALNFMPKYLSYFELKYLNVLFNVLKSSLNHKYDLSEQIISLLFERYNSLYKQLTINPLSYTFNVRLRFEMWLLFNSPFLFRYYCKLVVHTN